MSLTVGELVAYIRADGSEFDRTLDQSGSKFQGFGRTVQSGTQAVGRAFAGTVTAVAGLTGALFSVGQGYNRLQQSSRAALSTLLGGAEAANAQMDKLDEFARNSPFAKQVFIKAQQQLLGFGVQAEKVLPTLDAIQNAVAATGGSNVEIERVTYAFSQMQAAGKLSGETLRDLGIYGIDAATLLGKEFGKTGAEIRALASKPGGIPVEQVWDPLVGALLERFGGATDGIKQQMDGALDRVKGAWRDIGSIIAAPFIDPQGGGRAVEWVNKVADSLRAAEQKAKPFVDLLVKRFSPALDAVAPLLDQVRSGLNSWDLSKVNGQLDKLAKYGAPVAGVSAALFAMGTTNLPVLSTLGLSGINPVVAGLAALIAASPGLRAAGRDFLQALDPLLPIAQQLAVQILDTAMAAGRELTPALAAVLQAAAPLIVSLGTDLAGAVSAVLDALLPVVEVGADLVTTFAELPTPVLAAVAAFAALRALGAAQVFSGLATAVRTFNEHAAVQAALAGSSSRQVGLLGAAAVSAQGGVRALGAALKAAFITNPIGLAIAGVSAALGILIGKQADSRARIDQLADSFDEATGAITRNTEAVLAKQLQDRNALSMARELGIAEGDLTQAIMGSLSARARVANAIRETKEASDAMLDSQGFLDEGMNRQTTTAARLEAIMGEVNGEFSDAKERNAELAAATGRTAEATSDHAQKVRELIDAQREQEGAVRSLREAQIRETEAQEKATAAIDEGAQVARDASGAIDLQAESTRNADSELLNLVGSNVQVTDAMRRSNASAADLDGTIRKQREAFILTAERMGYTRGEAERLASSYGLIPDNVYTEVRASTGQAERTIDTFIAKYNGRSVSINVHTNGNLTPYVQYAPNALGGIVKMFAGGGFHGLTPMDSIAQVVPPNTWRVVGDRARDPEAYIPLDGSVRSLAILDRAAEYLGRRVVPMADGGVVTRAAATPAAPAPAQRGPSTLVLRVGEREFTAYVDELAGAVLAAEQRHEAGTRHTRGASW